MAGSTLPPRHYAALHGPHDLYVTRPPWDIGRPQAAGCGSCGRMPGGSANWASRSTRCWTAGSSTSSTATVSQGGRYFILGFSDRQQGEWGPVHKLTRAEIEAAFADGWRLDSIEPSTIEITTDPDGIRAWLVALTRT